MAEAVPYGAVANILSNLASSAFREISSVYHVENDMKKLEETVTTIKAALEDIDQKEEKKQLVRAWIKNLNGVVYAADDVLDAFCTKALQREDGRDLKTRVREFFSSSNRFVFGYTMSQEIKEIRERFDKISKDMANCSLMTTTKRVSYEERETHSHVLMSDVIGREKEIKEIVELLMCSSNKKENVNVIPIVGIGGLGKTTLAQSVYGHERVVEYFELRIWVSVYQEFETKPLVRKMLRSITNDDVEKLQLEQLQNRLRKELDGKRYLLILDDVWNENNGKWEDVKNLLMGGAKGSSIVVTTRSRKVASVMSVEPPYVLKGLSEENSWTLIKKVASRGDEKDDSKLKEFGEEIVKRCKGVPLAVRSLAGAMRSMTDKSEIWSLCEDDDGILPILRLSYDHLPTQLRQCFTYCSIFPKGSVIKEEELIQLWMALGYIQSGSHDMEGIGGKYFGELLSRSFFQADEHKGVMSYKMHDLMHDLAVSVAGSDCLIAKTDEVDDIFEKVHHVSLEPSLSKFPRQLLKAKGLRTMFHTNFEPKREITSIILSSQYRRLRVLKVHCRFFGRLSEVITVVPHSIGQLQHLRYLDLSENRMKSLPNSIGNLVNLQTLKLSYCSELERLPRGITKLIRLRYLVFNGCWKLYHMPTGLGKLTSLRKVSKYTVGKDQGSLQLSELEGLNELRGELRITGLENASSESKAAILIEKQFLHSLTLEWGRSDGIGDDEIVLESLKPHSQLKELSIINYAGNMFPNWMNNMVSSLQNIVCISLDGCHRCQHLSPLLLDQLPFLKTLNLKGLHRVKHIDDDDNNNLARKSSSSLFFPSLEELLISNMPNLEGWWRSAGTVVTDCLTSSSITTAAEQVAQHHLSFSRLTKLHIHFCPRLTFIPMTPNLEELRLQNVCEKLVHQLLTTKTTASESASSSSKLRVLHISYIDDLEYLTKEAVRNLSSLERLSIYGCYRLVSVVEEEEDWFRGLTYLSINSCDSLRSLSPLETQYPTALETLHTALETLSISKCRNFDFSGEWLRGLTSLRHLYFDTCHSLTSLTPQYLTALQSLSILNCEKFDLSGDDGLRWEDLTSLRELIFEEIPKLVSLPVGLKHVTTLQELRISKCHGLMALPEWLRDLNSLQYLQISLCPLLSKRCREGTGQDWPNISHIPNIVIDEKPIRGRYIY